MGAEAEVFDAGAVVAEGGDDAGVAHALENGGHVFGGVAEGGDAGGVCAGGGGDDFVTEGLEGFDDLLFEVEDAGGDFIDADGEDEVDGGFHAVDAGDVERAGFVALGGGVEGDFGLGDEVRGEDVPCAEEGGADEVEMFFLHVDDADGEGAEHPFVGVGAEEVDVLDGGGECAEGLDGIEGEEDAALVEEAADGIDIDAVSGEEAARGEGDEAGARGECGGDDFGGDLAGAGGLELADDDAFAGEIEPGVDVGGVIAGVADDFVAGLPLDAVCEEAEAEGGGAEEGDLIGLGADELGAGDAGLFYIVQHLGEFLRLAGGILDVAGHGVGDGRGEGGDAGVGHEDFAGAHGECGAAGGFVEDEGFDGWWCGWHCFKLKQNLAGGNRGNGGEWGARASSPLSPASCRREKGDERRPRVPAGRMPAGAGKMPALPSLFQVLPCVGVGARVWIMKLLVPAVLAVMAWLSIGQVLGLPGTYEDLPLGALPPDVVKAAVQKNLSPQGKYVILIANGTVRVFDAPQNIAKARAALADLQNAPAIVSFAFIIKTGMKKVTHEYTSGPAATFPVPATYAPPQIVGNGRSYIVIPATPTSFTNEVVGTTTTITQTEIVGGQARQYSGFTVFPKPAAVTVNARAADPAALHDWAVKNGAVPQNEPQWSMARTEILVTPSKADYGMVLTLQPQIVVAAPDGSSRVIPLKVCTASTIVKPGGSATLDGFPGADPEFYRIFLGAPESVDDTLSSITVGANADYSAAVQNGQPAAVATAPAGQQPAATAVQVPGVVPPVITRPAPQAQPQQQGVPVPVPVQVQQDGSGLININVSQ